MLANPVTTAPAACGVVTIEKTTTITTSMPKRSRGFWVCDYCELTFDHFEEAKAHETQACPVARGRAVSSAQQQQQQQQQPYPYGGGDTMAPSADRYGYEQQRLLQQQQYQQQGRGNMMWTRLLLEAGQSVYLSEADSMACRSLELFQLENTKSSPQEASQSEGSGVIQLGIRCCYCRDSSSQQRPTTRGSYVVPNGVAALGVNVRLLAENHLLACPNTPADVSNIMRLALQRRSQMRAQGGAAWQEEEHSQRTLVEFCSARCHQLGIVNKVPEKSGIMLGDPSQQQPHPGAMSQVPSKTGGMVPQNRWEQAPPMDPSYAAQYRGGGQTGSEQIEPMPLQQPQPGQQHDQQQNPYSSAFPFFQAPNGDWMCKYCCNVPPEYREQHFIWSTPSKEPPAINFVNHHLSYCREFNRSSVAYFQQGAPPPEFQFLGLPSPSGYPVHEQQQQQQRQQSWGNTTPTAMPSEGFHPQDYSQRRIPVDSAASPYDQGVAAPLSEGSGPSPAAQDYSPLATSSSLTPSRAGGDRGISVAGDDDIDVTTRRAIEHLIANDLSLFDNNGQPVTEEAKLVVDEDRLLLTEYFFYLMKQLRLVRFSESDRRTRGGKREKIQVGYGGLQCVHCSDAANARKFFWSNVDRLANSFAEIPGHILKCRRCPQATKDALLQLKKLHPEQMARLPRGSQKVFFRRMWRRLHDDDPVGTLTSAAGSATSASPPSSEEQASAVGSSGAKRRKRQESGSSSPPAQQQQQQQLTPLDTKPAAAEHHSPARTAGSDESIILFERPATEAAKALADASMQAGPPSPSSRVLLAIPEDKEWLSDTDCFVRRQIEVFCATRDDVQASRVDRKYGIQEGQVGIRCAHCGPAARLNAVSYPFAISGVYESVREFQRLHLEECPNLPPAVKSKLDHLKGCSSLSSVLRKYYVLSAQALGLHDTKDGVRAGAKSVPVGSQATTSFAFTEVQPVARLKGEEDEEEVAAATPLSGAGSIGLLSRTTSPGVGSTASAGGLGGDNDPFPPPATGDEESQEGQDVASRKRKSEDEAESPDSNKKRSPVVGSGEEERETPPS